MPLPIKHQLITIVQTLAYKAFGLNIPLSPQKISFSTKRNESDLLYYKLPIPRLIYEQYAKDGFVYADEGVTPKQIADDIIVHFKQLGQVQMSSDQFGNIVCAVKDNYFKQTTEKILDQNKIALIHCPQLDFHLNQSIQANKLTQDILTIKKLFLLFRNKRNLLSLSQLRQKYIFQSVLNIERDIFHNQTQFFQSFNNQDSNEIIQFLQKNDVNTITFGCVQHEIMKKQIFLDKLFGNLQKKKLSSNVNCMKFGLVGPQNLQINESLSKFSQQQKIKLRKTFLDYDIRKPIHLQKVFRSDSQFKLKLSKSQIQLPQRVDELILKTQQYLSRHKIIQLNHMYISLQDYLTKTNVNKHLIQQDIKKMNIFRDTAKIIRDHLQRILLLASN